MCSNEEIIKKFLNKCKIVFENFEQLDGMSIPRDILLSNEIYEDVKKDIDEIKKFYSSGSMTALQKNAGTSQKWPLLNLVRQILKACNFKMTPKRVSAGYTKDGKKLYKRIWLNIQLILLMVFQPLTNQNPDRFQSKLVNKINIQ